MWMRERWRVLSLQYADVEAAIGTVDPRAAEHRPTDVAIGLLGGKDLRRALARRRGGRSVVDEAAMLAVHARARHVGHGGRAGELRRELRVRAAIGRKRDHHVRTLVDTKRGDRRVVDPRRLEHHEALGPQRRGALGAAHVGQDVVAALACEARHRRARIPAAQHHHALSIAHRADAIVIEG